MPIIIREAQSDADRKAAFALRHKVQVKELGRNYRSDQEGLLSDEYDDLAHLLVAEDEGRIVGTVRMVLGKNGPLEMESVHHYSLFAPYYPEHCLSTSKLVVDPEYRGTSAAGLLALACYDYSRKGNIQFGFVDVRPHLVRMYQQMGYRFFQENIHTEEAGALIPMVIVAEDVDYLKAIRSPFLRVARKFKSTSRAPETFASDFPEYARLRPSFCWQEEELWEVLRQGMQRPGGHLSLLDGLSEDEISQVLKLLDPISYHSGDRIILEGDVSDGMFCLMEGQLEVLVKDKANQERLVDIIGPGEVFGEMGFVTRARRNATILAREPSRVLVLTRNSFLRLEKKSPHLTIQLMTNLLANVVQRFEVKRRETLNT